MNSIPTRASKAARGPAEISSPLRLWRGLEPSCLGKAQAASLRAAPSWLVFLDSPDWRLAVEDDTARAVRIALQLAAGHQRRLWAIDDVAPALPLYAAGGDPAAAARRGHLPRRFGIPQPIAPGEV